MITRELLTKYRKLAYRMIIDNAVAWQGNGGGNRENMQEIFKENFPDNFSQEDFEIVFDAIIRKLAGRAE